MNRRKVIIMGAAGRDFHNFNVYFRDNPRYEVVAFTATQIFGIAGRRYPSVLSGRLYPRGIPIYDEEQLRYLVVKHNIEEVVLAYSDLSHDYVMQKAELVLSTGASFTLLGPSDTQIKSKKPVIAVCAVRTGVGKSEVTRYVGEVLKKLGKRYVVIRHPMPYGVLKKQVWQRYETYEDLKKYNCTIEEREEYEPHIKRGEILYAGVDYEEILKRAEKEVDVIVWDGGNNDFSFYQPDLLITLVDPHRPGHELKYYPGQANMMMADVVLINKENTARKSQIDLVRTNVKKFNPRAVIVDGASLITLTKPKLIKGKRVLVVEDGPTLTHGGMSYGAGSLAAKKYGCKLVDPRPYARGSLKEVFKKFKQLTNVLPAEGYSNKQLSELQATINAIPADAVVIGTPIRLDMLLKINKPTVRVSYNFKELGNRLPRIIKKITG
ncbi:GTPase [Candidatus Woesearchaeota archaeon]|jgi:predicted GTPase|nr:GTPase [Candidatus Woesearchaeota archaeon]MBT4114197.1 GTPase [Candidatus Woesearchaeota archaeon]MBT4248265.1 GTPase [Candidatus Woesearchaeota archaeon]